MDSETCEQLNSFLKKSLYFIDTLSPLNYMHVIKALLSLRNKDINSRILGETKHYSFDKYGRLIFAPANPQQSKQCINVTDDDGKLPVKIVNNLLIAGNFT